MAQGKVASYHPFYATTVDENELDTLEKVLNIEWCVHQVLVEAILCADGFDPLEARDQCVQLCAEVLRRLRVLWETLDKEQKEKINSQ